MNKTKLQKHHIIPRHMGGTDDPSNLIEVTIEEHAELHKKLWEEKGQEWDRIAWLALSGLVHTSEVSKMVHIEGCKKGGKVSSQRRKKNGTSIKDWIQKTGFVRAFTKEDCIKGAKKAGKIGVRVMNAQRWICLECGKVDRPAALGWHMKKQNHVLRVQL